MNHRYSHILTPVRVGDLVLKNRLINSKSIPEGWQGQDPASYMTEQTISFAANIARNGASVVTCSPGMFRQFKGRTFFTSPFDMDDRNIQANFRRLIERIHQYGAAANASTMCNVPNDVSISSMPDRSIVPTEYSPGPESPFDMQGNLPPEITKEQIRTFIREFTDCAAELKDMGFDMINVYASYNASLLAKSLSPVFNQRTDEYGGSLENRARLLKELLTSVKEACGWGFPIELQLSGRENVPGGYTEEDFVEYCRIFDNAGLADIIQVRAWTGDMTHASSYNCQKDYPTNLRFAEMLKKAGIRALVAPVGGFQDLDLIERFLSEGRTDLVAMGRAFICDPEYGKKLYEGRGEDVIACLRCDKCHSGICAVNPRIGIAPSLLAEEDSRPAQPRKVAVIGGGPAGLYTAAECARLGHSVVLYEKDETLGGQARHADFMPNKWCMKDYKDSLIRACERSGVEIHTGVKADRALIEGGDFDAVVAALGSVPKTGPVEGADLSHVWKPVEVFGHHEQLGEHVVVIGGAMIAVDTALYLCQTGHKVTLVTRNREVAYDNNSHSHFQFEKSLHEEPDLEMITRAQTLKITREAVTVEVTSGGGPAGGPPGMPPPPGGFGEMPAPEPEKKEIREIPCDSVVFSAGRRPLIDESLEFAGITPKFFIVGDANMLSGDPKQRHPGETSKPAADATPHEIRHGVLTGYAAAHAI